MKCSTCNSNMGRVKSDGPQNAFILFDFNQKDHSGNFETKDGIVLEAFLCQSCGEYRFKAPKV